MLLRVARERVSPMEEIRIAVAPGAGGFAWAAWQPARRGGVRYLTTASSCRTNEREEAR